MVTTTQLIHHHYTPPEGFVAPQVPTYQASTVIFPNVASMCSTQWRDKSGYTYGLHGTPTTFTLEERLASLEGALYCQLVPSGLAAIALVNLSLLKTGDEVLIPSNVYAPNLALVQGELAHYGITHQVYDPMSLEDLAKKITPQTRLVWVEAPGSVTMEFPDLQGIARLCKDNGVLSALDNTWGAGLAFNAFDLEGMGIGIGVDLTIQALTKYASGGADVLMGCVCTRQSSIDQHLKLTHMRLGLGVGADDVQTVLRSLPSMALRYRAQDATARTLALALESQAEVAQVLHPSLKSSPGHEHWVQCCTGHANRPLTDHGGSSREPEHLGLAASIFSIIFKPEYDQAQVDAFCDSLKLFKIGYSWGGPMSLVVPYDLPSIRPKPSTHQPLAKGRLVRLCIGLEDATDLLEDLKQSIEKAFGQT